MNPFDANGSGPPVAYDEAKVAAAVKAALDPEEFDAAVEDELFRHDVRERVRAVLHARDWAPPASYGSLVEELALPDEAARWRVDGLLPAGGNAVLVAGRKAGKTTTVVELVRSLADGHPFLGRFSVEPLGDGETVALFNYEMTERQMRDWLRRAGIRNAGRVRVLHLRGERLPLSSPHVRQWVTAWLSERRVRAWVVDPYSRAYLGSVENGNDEAQVSAFLDHLDVIKAEAGVTELVMPVHTPKGARYDASLESAIGSQRLEAWPDALWYLGRDGDAPTRYLRAEGRDVDVPDGQVTWDPVTYRLTMAEGAPSRAEAARSARVAPMIAYLREHGRVNRTDLMAGLGVTSGSAFKKLTDAARQLLVVESEGSGKPTWYSLATEIADLISGGRSR